MSTLTSHSPSPASSPHTAFGIRSPRPKPSYHTSPRSSPRPFSGSASPRRAFNAPPASSSASRQSREQRFVESGQVVERRGGRYTDAGTQYSPEGYPPTAGRSYKVAVVGGVEVAGQQPPGSAGSGKKRKEITRSESPQGPMSELISGTASSSAAERSAYGTAPSEPQPRTDPTNAAVGSSEAQNADMHQRTADEVQAEPQEVRSTHGHSSAPKRSRQEPVEVKQMPRAYWTCVPKDLGVLISNMLMELIRINDQIPLRDGRLTRFHSRAPPGISVADYLQRLVQHATLSPPILLSMVYYIDRLCAMYPAFTINSLTAHRFLITAATVAAKGLSDSFWTNPTYARIGGIPTTELATLELEFLQKVEWKIVPKPEVLEDYYRSLVERTEGYELEPSGSESSSLDESMSGEGDGNDDEAVVNDPT